MSTPYFNAPDRLFILEKEALTWLGTPFAAHAAVKHGGVDCVRLVAAIYIATGFMKEFSAARYAMGEGSHRHESKLLAWFEGRTDFSRHVPADGAPQPGDTLCFKMHLSEHHAGIMLGGGYFLHVLPGRFVVRSALRESIYGKRITTIYRPLNMPITVPHTVTTTFPA